MDLDTLEFHLNQLSLNLSARLDDIKKAYRNKAKQWHPDRNTGGETIQRKSLRKMQQLNSAYEYLKAQVTESGVIPRRWHSNSNVKNTDPCRENPYQQSFASGHQDWHEYTASDFVVDKDVPRRSYLKLLNLAAIALGILLGIYLFQPARSFEWVNPNLSTSKPLPPTTSEKLSRWESQTTSTSNKKTEQKIQAADEFELELRRKSVLFGNKQQAVEGIQLK